MNNKLLLPNRYKRIGFMLFIPSLIMGILVRFFDLNVKWLQIRGSGGKALFDDEINLTDELALTGLVVSLLFIAFGREKNEDEFIAHTRLESLKWAVLVNYGLLLAATWLVHGWGYIDVMMYNMLTVLIFFIIRFHYVLARNKNSFE